MATPIDTTQVLAQIEYQIVPIAESSQAIVQAEYQLVPRAEFSQFIVQVEYQIFSSRTGPLPLFLPT
jgi:hypothetical protein